MDRHCARLREFLIPFRARCGAQFCVRAFSDSRSTCVTTLIGSRANNCQSFIRHGGGACVTESMSVLTDPATCGIPSSELTNCPRTAAVLGELAAEWQQMMGTLQRFEQEAQNTADAIENLSRTRTSPEAGRATRHLEGLHARSPHGWGTSIRSMKLGNGSSRSRRGRSERPRRGLTAATLKMTNTLNWTTSWRWHMPT